MLLSFCANLVYTRGRGRKTFSMTSTPWPSLGSAVWYPLTEPRISFCDHEIDIVPRPTQRRPRPTSVQHFFTSAVLAGFAFDVNSPVALRGSSVTFIAILFSAYQYSSAKWISFVSLNIRDCQRSARISFKFIKIGKVNWKKNFVESSCFNATTTTSVKSTGFTILF